MLINDVYYKFKNFLGMWNYLCVQYIMKNNKCLYLYTNQFDLILDYHLNNNKEYYRVKEQNLKGSKRSIAFEVFETFVIRDMKYYHGTDKLDSAAALKLAIDNKPKRWTSSYTGQIGKALNIDAIKKSFEQLPFNLLNNMLMNTSQGAIIYSTSEEHENVYCYDVVSAYPTILLGKVPNKFIRSTYKPAQGKIHFGKIIIKNFKAKNVRLIPLYRGKEIPKDCVIAGKRIVAGTSYSYYGFIEHELRILKNYYDCESISVSDVYECEMEYLPEESRNSIKTVYDNKLAAKGTDNYDGYKQMFNRIFGYFITTYEKDGELKIRDKDVPYQIGLWIISQQRQIMLDAIEAVGLENVVAAHTDGIKVVGNFNDVFEEINQRRGTVYKDLGRWELEEVIDKIQYLSNVKAKYIVNGELKMKHGGLSDVDTAHFLMGKTYEEINGNSIISFTTKKKVIENENGVYVVLKRVEIPLSAIE